MKTVASEATNCKGLHLLASSTIRFLALAVSWLSILGSRPAWGLTQEELDSSRSRWEQQSLLNYDFVSQRYCFCFGDIRRPGRVQVRAGEIVSVLDVETSEPLDAMYFWSMDGIFDELQAALDRPAFHIETQFDRTYHFPVSVSIDYEQWIADEELFLEISEFRVVTPLGDFDENGVLNIADLNALSMEIASMTHDLRFDLDDSQIVDHEDLRLWVKDLKGTWFGDANLDGEFNSGDLVAVFAVGQYEDAIDANSGWLEGDWNADLEFNSGDLVAAFQDGGYEKGPRIPVAMVPEPEASWMVLDGLVLCGLMARRSYGSSVRRPRLDFFGQPSTGLK